MEQERVPWWNIMDPSSPAVAALYGRWCRIETELIAYIRNYELISSLGDNMEELPSSDR
jgi:hypothetical protein